MGESLSTLVAATLQYVSACRRSHSFSESVYFTSLSFFRLVRSFHDISPNFPYLSFLFLFFSKGIPRDIPHDNFSYYILNAKLRQAILRRFSAFLTCFLYRSACSYG